MGIELVAAHESHEGSRSDVAPAQLRKRRSDRVVVLHRGRVLDAGPPEEVVARAGAADVGEAFLAMTGKASAPDLRC